MSGARMNRPGPWARDIKRFCKRIKSISNEFDFVYASTTTFSSSPHSVLVSIGLSTDPDCEETEIEFYFYAGRLVIIEDSTGRKRFNTYKEAAKHVEDILFIWAN